jgi:hypothetical protein
VLRKPPTVVVSLSLALGLLLAACSAPAQPTLNLGSGKEFLPQVVDFLDNVGLDPSMTLDPNGNPVIAYFGVPQELKPGEIPPSHPIGSPTLPGVLYSTLVDGIWTKGAVVDDVKDLTVKDATGTGIAVDGQDKIHAVWSTTKGIWYATNAQGDFKPEQIDKGPVAGPSIALDSSGAPWVAYYLGDSVYAGTLKGKRWDIQKVAGAGTCTDCSPVRTATAAGGKGGAFVAFSDLDTQTPMIAWPTRHSWKIDEIEPGVGGSGISITTEGNGTPHVAYYTSNGEIHVASTSTPGSSQWKIDTVGTYTTTGDAVTQASAIATSQKGTRYVSWVDPGFGVVLASDESGAFKPIRTQGTQGGGMPAIAVPPDGSTVYVAWYDPLDENLQLGTYAQVAAEVALAKPSPTPAAGVSTPTPPAALCTPGPKSLDVTAKGIQFLENCLAAPADQKFTITFKNEDAGVPHNVEIIDQGPATDPTAKQLFAPPDNATVTGPATEKYNVDPLKPGTYYFYCFVHPTSMFGNFVVAGK